MSSCNRETDLRLCDEPPDLTRHFGNDEEILVYLGNQRLKDRSENPKVIIKGVTCIVKRSKYLCANDIGMSQKNQKKLNLEQGMFIKIKELMN